MYLARYLWRTLLGWFEISRSSITKLLASGVRAAGGMAGDLTDMDVEWRAWLSRQRRRSRETVDEGHAPSDARSCVAHGVPVSVPLELEIEHLRIKVQELEFTLLSVAGTMRSELREVRSEVDGLKETVGFPGSTQARTTRAAALFLSANLALAGLACGWIVLHVAVRAVCMLPCVLSAVADLLS